MIPGMPQSPAKACPAQPRVLLLPCVLGLRASLAVVVADAVARAAVAG